MGLFGEFWPPYVMKNKLDFANDITRTAMESIQVEKAFVFKIFAVSSVAYGTSVNTFYCTLPMYL